MAERSPRRVVVAVLQYAVGIGLLAWLLATIDLGNVATLLSRLDARTIAALLAVTATGLFARFYTWHAVIDPLEPVRYRAAASVDLIVLFVNQLLPSRLTGRVAAPFVVVAETGASRADAAAAAGVHTGMYAVYYGAVSLAGLVLALDRLRTGLVVVLALSTGLYLGAGAVVLLAGTFPAPLERLVDWVARFARPVPLLGERVVAAQRRLSGFVAASTVSFGELTAAPGVWARYAVGWTGSVVLAPGLRVWLLLSGFGVVFEPAPLLALYLVTAYSVTLLPLTPGGIGVTEATATAVFVGLGVPAEAAVPVVVLDRFIGVYLPALGGWYPSVRLERSLLATGEG